MKKFLALGTMAALLFSGCTSNSAPEPQADDNYVGVCMNEKQERVDDSMCSDAPEYQDDNGSTMSGLFWGYIIASALMPNYGGNVTNYVTRVDDTRHNVYRGGVPRSGGYVDFNKYKPISSKTTAKPKSTLKSGSYNQRFNKSPNYKPPAGKSGTTTKNQYKKSGGGTTYKAPKSSGGGYKGGSSGGFKSGGRR